jgi:hypothetical protein
MTNDRIDAIATSIRGACCAIKDELDEFEDHKAAAKALEGALTSTSRLDVATRVAALSAAETWTASEIARACKRAGDMGNAAGTKSDKSLGVFISEMKTFASPQIRTRVPDILKNCQQIWDEEAELTAELKGADKKGADAPAHKFKSRIYHFTLDVARKIADGKLTNAVSAIVDYCRDNDPDHDEKKVEARLKTVVAMLDKIYDDFGMEEMQRAAEYVRTITAKELLTARAAKLAAEAEIEEGRMAAYSLAPVPPIVTAPVSQPQADTDTVEGAVNIDQFAGLMNDPVALAA